MNYIYDILLDFNDLPYDFFDWNEEDKITHIRKIPLFKIEANKFDLIRNNIVKVNKEFLEKINNKTEAFENHKIANIPYCCLFSNGLEVLAVIFNEKGIIEKYSNLLLDENDEVIEVCERLEESLIDFKLINKKKKYGYLTRNDINIIKYINSEVDNLKNEKDIEKVKYLYYELFDEKSDNVELILNKIKEEILNTKSKFYLKLFNFLKLTSLKK